MKETAEQYVARILGNVGKRDPLKGQTATPSRMRSLIRGASPAALRRRPAPGKWSVGEILAHLAEAELVGGHRVRTMLGASGSAIQAYDQDVWTRSAQYQRWKLAEALALFRALREANVRLLRSLSPRQWNCYGMPQERGRESIRRLAALYVGHNPNHLAQIESILRPKQARHRKK